MADVVDCMADVVDVMSCGTWQSSITLKWLYHSHCRLTFIALAVSNHFSANKAILHSDLAKRYQIWGDCLIDDVFDTAMQAGIEQ